MTRFWIHRHLIYQLTKREVVGRYRGSVLGLLWSFFNPLFLLVVFTLVFSVVFKMRWPMASAAENKMEFALILFTGLIMYNLFAEVVTRSPGLILANANYVKKVVFPLEVLPVVTLGSALFHAAISMLVLLLCNLLVLHTFSLGALIFIPLLIIPLILVILGFAWFLASLGVFLRDVSQAIVPVITALMFLSPVFYPVTAMPEAIRAYLFLNPLTFVIEQSRNILYAFAQPDWVGLGIYALIGLAVSRTGLYWFDKTRKGFADVI